MRMRPHAPFPQLRWPVLLVAGLLVGLLHPSQPGVAAMGLVPDEAALSQSFTASPFAPNVVVAGPGRPVPHQVEPYIVVDSRNRLFVGWKEAETAEGPGWRVAFARSLDRGQGWSAPKLMATLIPSRHQSDPWLVVDEADRLYYARLDYEAEGAGSGVTVSRSDDAGETWGPPVDVQDQPNFADKESMTSDGNGTLYLAYDDVSEGTGGISIRLAHSRDGGQTWSPTSAVSPTAEGASPVIAAWPDGSVAVAWWEFGTGDIHAATSWDRGASWTEPVRVNPQPGSATGLPSNPWAFPLPSLVVDAQGRLFLAWPEGDGEDWNILVARSEDRGLTWSSPVRVNDDSSGREQRMASLAVDRLGVVHTAWLDNRSGNLHIFYSNTTDGGNTWSPNVRVSTGETSSGFRRPGDYLGLAADDNGTAYVVWTDGRGEDLDIYFAAGDFAPPTVEILSPRPGTWLFSSRVELTGSATDNVGLARVEVSTDGTAWEPAAGTTAWIATLTVARGVSVLYARATDHAGNAAIVTIEVRVVLERFSTSLILAVGVGGGLLAAAILLRKRSRRQQER